MILLEKENTIELGTNSLRGMLIEVITQSHIKNYLFDDSLFNDSLVREGFQKKLQEKLNRDLKFETKISINFEIKDELCGEIYFENEDGKISTMNFHVINSHISEKTDLNER